MMHFNPHAGKPLDYSESPSQRRTRLAAFLRTLIASEDCLSRPKREPVIHRWNPLTARCLDCGVERIVNDTVPYGWGVPCESGPERQETSKP